MDMLDIERLAAARRHVAHGTGRSIREAASLSQAEVAQAIGADESTVWRWEHGITRPRGERAVRWAQLLERLRSSSPAA